MPMLQQIMGSKVKLNWLHTPYDGAKAIEDCRP
jgi:hypothetical protein